MSDQSRASAWHILRWCDELDVERVILENVREFADWGPLHAADHAEEAKRNRPVEREKGRYFRNFLRNLRCLGYRVEWRLLNAADYGDATTRTRFFLQARKGRTPIRWPERTHYPRPRPARKDQPALDLFTAEVRHWRPAREIIDWTLTGESIFTRKRPLAPNTLRRIFAGLQKFCGIPFLIPNFTERDGQAPRVHSVEGPLPTVTGHGAGALVQPYVVVNRAHGSGPEGCSHSVEDPIRSLTTGDNMALVQPFLLPHQHGSSRDNVRSVEQPLPTVTGTSADMFLAQPFIVPQFSSQGPRSVEEPLGVVTTTSRGVALIEPFIVGAGGPAFAGEPASVDDPLGTVVARNHRALVQPWLVVLRNNCDGRSLDDPTPTLAAGGKHVGLAEAFVTPLNHGGKDLRSHSLRMPFPTITSVDAWGLVQPYLVNLKGRSVGRDVDEPMPTATAHASHLYLAQPQPFLVKYHGTGGALSVDDPLDTISTRDRFGLAIPELGLVGEVVGVLDILFRMLQPHELAAAMSFPKSYHFSGNREQKVRQIGNAVGVEQANALCRAALST